MVRKGFDVAIGNIDIGAASHVLAACSEEFAVALGLYFDNDTARFPRRISLH